MKLGMALNKRAELSKQLSELKTQISRTLWYHTTWEGDPLSEEDAQISKSLEIHEHISAELRNIITKINLTNATTNVLWWGKSISLTELLSIREECAAMAKLYSSIVKTLSQSHETNYDYSRKKVSKYKGLSAIELAKARKEGIEASLLESAAKDIEEENLKLEAEKDKIVPIITYGDTKELANKYAKHTRFADNLLQEVNWKTDVLE